jgi:hypothetical protein
VAWAISRRELGGEGGVRYDKTRKSWIGTITLGWEAATNDDGEVICRQKRRSVTGKTKAEVLERLREAQNLHGDGITLPPAPLTVGTMLERWITYIVPGTVATLTEQQYRHIVTKMLIPASGESTSKRSPRSTSR